MIKRLLSFGDSWAWSWISNTHKLKNTVSTNDSSIKIFNFDEFVSPHAKDLIRLSTYPYYFSKFNLDFLIRNKPANDLTSSVNAVINNYIPDKHNDAVLFFNSSIIRNTTHLNKLGFDCASYDSFMNLYKQKTQEQYQRLAKYSQEHNIPILLVGGQTPIIDELVPENLHVVCTDLLVTLCEKYLMETVSLGHFRLATNWVQQSSENWDKKLIDHVYADIEHAANVIDTVLPVMMWHDTGHLNPTGQFYATDIIMDYLNQKELTC